MFLIMATASPYDQSNFIYSEPSIAAANKKRTLHLKSAIFLLLSDVVFSKHFSTIANHFFQGEEIRGEVKASGDKRPNMNEQLRAL